MVASYRYGCSASSKRSTRACRCRSEAPATPLMPVPGTSTSPVSSTWRQGRAIDEVSTAVGGLPLMSQDRVWDRVRTAGLDELLQFDWAMVGESDALAAAITECGALGEIDIGAAEERVNRLREAIADRRRYIEILA